MEKIYEYLLNQLQMQHYKFWIEVLILVAVLRPEAYKDVFKFIKYIADNLKKQQVLSLFKIILKKHNNGVKDALAFDAELDKDRITFNAANVNYGIYHNGVSANFRNWSMRNESIRSGKYAFVGVSQQQSLSPFYKLIKLWETTPVIITKVSDPSLDYNALIKFNLKSVGCHTLINIPICVPKKQVYPSTKISLVLNINGEECAVLGCYSVLLDNESLPCSDEDIRTYFSAKIDVLRDYYIRIPNAVLK